MVFINETRTKLMAGDVVSLKYLGTHGYKCEVTREGVRLTFSAGKHLIKKEPISTLHLQTSEPASIFELGGLTCEEITPSTATVTLREVESM
jgi:hypothetical protein